MPRRFIAALMSCATIVLASGCGSPESGDTSEPTSSARADNTARVQGAVTEPLNLTSESLRNFPLRTLRDSSESSAGLQEHDYQGAAFIDVLNAAQPKFDPAVLNGALRLAVVVTGSNGNVVTFSWGELAPEFGGEEALLAHTEDGEPLTMPRLMIPGDEKGGRYVTDVVKVDVVDVTK